MSRKIFALTLLATWAIKPFTDPASVIKSAVSGGLYSILMTRRNISLSEKLCASGIVAFGGYMTPNQEEMIPAFTAGMLTGYTIILLNQMRRNNQVIHVDGRNFQII